MQSSEPRSKGKAIWSKLKEAGKTVGAAAKSASKKAKVILGTALEASAQAAAAARFADRHGIDLEWVRSTLQEGRILIPESAINEWLDARLEDDRVKAARVGCEEGNLVVQVSGSVCWIEGEAEARLRFTRGDINPEQHVFELEVLDDPSFKAKGPLGRAVLWVLLFIAARALCLKPEDALSGKIPGLHVKDRCVSFDLAKHPKLKPLVVSGVGGFTLLHLMEIEGVDPKKGGVEVRVKKGRLADVLMSALDLWMAVRKKS